MMYQRCHHASGDEEVGDTDVTGRSGPMRLPPIPSPDADAFEVVENYLSFYQEEYERARGIAKRDAMLFVILAASANGAIAVLGAAVAVTHMSWLGLVSTGVAGLAGVLAAWDGLFRNRELWVQKIMMLSQVLAIRRNAELRRAMGDDRDVIAQECMLRLGKMLDEDLVTWTELRRLSANSSEGRNPDL